VVEQGAPADIQVDDHQKDKNPGGADAVHNRYDRSIGKPAKPVVSLL
jgi:hypothetical protein